MFLIFAMSLSLPSFADAASLKRDLINAIRTTGEEETSKPGVKTILMTKKTAFGDTMYSFSTDGGCSIIMKTSPLAGAVGDFSYDEMGNLHCKLHTNGINGRLRFPPAKWQTWKNRSFKWRPAEFKECIANFRSGECSIRK